MSRLSSKPDHTAVVIISRSDHQYWDFFVLLCFVFVPAALFTPRNIFNLFKN